MKITPDVAEETDYLLHINFSAFLYFSENKNKKKLKKNCFIFAIKLNEI